MPIRSGYDVLAYWEKRAKAAESELATTREKLAEATKAVDDYEQMVAHGLLVPHTRLAAALAVVEAAQKEHRQAGSYWKPDFCICGRKGCTVLAALATLDATPPSQEPTDG